MSTVKDFYNVIDEWAPFSTCETDDNSGLLVGDVNAVVKKAVVALDITNRVIELAAQKGAQLIVSHHPVIFDPLTSLSADHPAYLLARHGIAAICAHSNLDMAHGGVNDRLAELLSLIPVAILEPIEEDRGYGFVAALGEKTTVPALAKKIKQLLHCGRVSYSPCDTEIQTVAVCGGAGGSMIEFAVKAGANTLITGDIKHSQWIEAQNRGIAIIDAGHFTTENVIVPILAKKLQESFPDLCVEIADGNDCPFVFD